LSSPAFHSNGSNLPPCCMMAKPLMVFDMASVAM
jgi:hypothetical protein